MALATLATPDYASISKHTKIARLSVIRNTE